MLASGLSALLYSGSGGNKGLAYMDSGVVLYLATILAAIATFGLTSSPAATAISCQGTIECLNQGVENTSGLLNVSRVCCNGFCVDGSTCTDGNSTSFGSTPSSLTNNTRTSDNTTNAGVVIISNNTKNSSSSLNSTTNSTVGNYRDQCSTSEDCSSSSEVQCLSENCAGIQPPESKFTECSCDPCQDGRCYNKTRVNEAPLISTEQKPAITPLQFMLLFGSMGGIMFMIVVVYCVKTLTDNRRRRYLLKYGVWPETEDKGQDSRQNEETSDVSGHNKKCEVPTITVEMEKEPSTSSISTKDGKSRTESKAEPAEAKENINAGEKGEAPTTDPGKSPGNDIQVQVMAQANTGIIKPKGSTKPIAKPIANSTHKPTTNETKNTQGSPVLKDQEFKIPDSPKPRFNVYGKGKDSPKKIMANGSPEKMTTLNRGKKGSPPVQLCEPENFSDYGM